VVAALFLGLKCAVLVLVVEALLRVARRALHGPVAWGTAVAAFLALAAFSLPFPLVVLAAAVLGYLMPNQFVAPAHGQAGAVAESLLDAYLQAHPGHIESLTAAARRAGLIALALWVWPVALLAPLGGVFFDVSWFFSKMSVVTFGGAYAVLAYVAQEAVEHYRWLSAPEMLAGLGLAETTPGPLILVLQFVGFLAGYREGGGVWGGIGASLLTLWVTFLPCFAWIFLGAPYVERLHDQRRLKGALAAVTAAVVGVIANLALWFALRVVFAQVVPGPLGFDVPVLTSVQPVALGLSLLAAASLFWWRLGQLWTLGVSAAVAGVLGTLP